MRALFLAILVGTSPVWAEDVIFLESGEKRVGQVVEIDDRQVRLRVPLAPPPGAGADAPPVFASVALDRAEVARIEFAADPALEKLLADASPATLAAVEAEWNKRSRWLAIPKSPSARVGLALGDLLLKTAADPNGRRALELFQQIEAGAWDESDRMQARQGRLRAMVATGRAADAVGEAMELAAVTENPAVIIEAKYILAEADEKALRQLVEDNPRWEEDIFVRPEHARLFNSAVDHYLYPALFHGSDTEAAARGLWGATRVYDFTGRQALAQECARDIVTLYPQTPFAAQASQFLAGLPEEIRSLDPERDARRDLESAAPEESPKPSNKKKSNEKKST
ncbi:MAG: hypothetical protein SFU53_14430 [Terrimicrobiaceae bacterium]|nr:hypothetical protein [Terrimicrobiaceae bacterium]